MDESVNTTKVNEYTVRCDILNSTLEYLTLLKLRDDLLALSLELCLDECLVRNNNIAELLIDLNNLELHCLAYEYVVVTYWMYVNLAAWKECLDAEYVNDHTTLSAALDVTLNDLLIIKSSVNTLPRLAEASLLVRKDQLTLLVFLILNVNLYNVTYLEVWVVTEFACCDDTIALVTDVNNNFLLVNRNYCTVDYLMLRHLVKS